MISWFDTLRDLPRLREIGRVLLRHGFGHVAQRLRLPGVRAVNAHVGRAALGDFNPRASTDDFRRARADVH